MRRAPPTLPDSWGRIPPLTRTESVAAQIAWFLVMLLATLAIARFGLDSMLWLLLYLWALAFWVLRANRVLPVLRQAWPVLLPPLLTLASVLWSVDPALSLRWGIQFSFTVMIAVAVAASVPPERALVLMLAAGLVGVLLSLMNLATSFRGPAFEPNGAFMGIYTQKNVAGRAFMMTMVGVLAYVALRPLRLVWTAPLIGLLLWLTLITDSTSALLSTGMLAAPLVMMGFRRSPTQRWVALSLALALPLLPVLPMLVGVDLIGWGLGLVGKTRDLTGRTDIWQAGWQVWSDHKLFGVGFGAFWENPGLFPIIEFVHATVDPRLNGFHNLIVETAVGLGVVGVAVVGFWLLWTLWVAFRWYITQGGVAASIWTGLLVIMVVLSMQDVSMMRQHEVAHILVTLAGVYASRSPRLRFRI